ncbi:hypothetical protein [Thiothrix sp.]|jgi:hypothetical protein|uniref:hypothetical protein n=1 Tax=Thiothrix sp. TaxID=1032 RepID=UPI00257B8BFA|nr:hypothetical protein [Thiothrix sp.]
MPFVYKKTMPLITCTISISIILSSCAMTEEESLAMGSVLGVIGGVAIADSTGDYNAAADFATNTINLSAGLEPTQDPANILNDQLSVAKTNNTKNTTTSSAGTPLSQCASFGKLTKSGFEGYGIKNICNQTIEVHFCVDSEKSPFRCSAKHSIGGAKTIGAGKESWIPDYKYDGGGSVYMASCSKGSYATDWRGPGTSYSCR